MAGADLFVICKKCGSEVSPYITECPYCGERLRKRAPKLERGGTPKAPRGRRVQRPSLGRLRHGEIPGIAADVRPWATIALVAAGVLGTLLWRFGIVDFARLALVGQPGADWWRLFTAPFVYVANGYALLALTATAIFGWLLERRHGRAAVVLVFLSAGSVGMLLASALRPDPLAAGANGAALGLLCAWAVPDLLARRRGEEPESDGLGVLVIALVLALLPLAAEEADAFAGLGGALVGLALGVPLARLSPPDR